MVLGRYHKEMGVEGRKKSAYESVLQPGAVKAFARHPNWTMPKDQLNDTAPASHREMDCQTCVWRFLCAYHQTRQWSITFGRSCRKRMLWGFVGESSEWWPHTTPTSSRRLSTTYKHNGSASGHSRSIWDSFSTARWS